MQHGWRYRPARRGARQDGSAGSNLGPCPLVLLRRLPLTAGRVSLLVRALLRFLDVVVDQAAGQPGAGARDSAQSCIAADCPQYRADPYSTHGAGQGSLLRIGHTGAAGDKTTT